jgi:hypothetical protein
VIKLEKRGSKDGHPTHCPRRPDPGHRPHRRRVLDQHIDPEAGPRGCWCLSWMALTRRKWDDGWYCESRRYSRYLCLQSPQLCDLERLTKRHSRCDGGHSPNRRGKWLVYIHTCLGIMFVMDRVTPPEVMRILHPPVRCTALCSLSESLSPMP